MAAERRIIQSCRVCESTSDLELLFKEENKDLLAKLRLVGNVPISEHDGLPQCVCNHCANELQWAFDFKTHYENAFYKTKKEFYNVFEDPQKDNVQDDKIDEETIEAVGGFTIENFQVVEHVVKEEFFSDSEDDIGTEDLGCGTYAGDSEHFVDYQEDSLKINKEKKLVKRESTESTNCYEDDLLLSPKRTNRRKYLENNDDDLNDFIVMKSNCVGNTVKVIENGDMFRDSPSKCSSSSRRKGGKKCAIRYERPSQAKKAKDNGNKLLQCNALCKRHENRTEDNQNIISNEIPNMLKCTDCDKSFSCKLTLRQHKLRHLNRQSLICEPCGKAFSSLYLYKEHRMLHTKPDYYKCGQCGKSFSGTLTLKRHQIKHSDPAGWHSCKQCGKSFKKANVLKEHEELHSNPDIFKCNHCNKRFLGRFALQRHEVRHSNPDLLRCEPCGKSFATLYYLKEHSMIHSNPNVFGCDKCSKSFTRKRGLKQHYLEHSGIESFPCKECGKSFKYAFVLREHQMWHSNPDTFKCGKCDKRFKGAKALKRHETTHFNRKKHACEQCGDLFSTAPYLKEHIKLHSNPNRYKCDKCEKYYTSKYRLSKHKCGTESSAS